MAPKKTIFIIPGFRQKASQHAYKSLAQMLKKEGFSPIPVNISWKQRTVSENTDEFLKQFKQVRRKEKYILGFSYGAMIAFLAATKVKTSGIILCSLSPYFKEDLFKKYPGVRADITKMQYKDFLNLPCSILAKKVRTKHVSMLYGDKESKLVISRVTQTFKLINAKQKYLLPVKKSEHNIADKRYQHTINFAAQQLLYL